MKKEKSYYYYESLECNEKKNSYEDVYVLDNFIKTLNLLFVEKHRGFAFVEFELAEVCWIFDKSVVVIVTNLISEIQ